jgi:integrase
MPLTDTQVRNAKPGNRPPLRRKGARNADDDSSSAYSDEQETVKKKHAGRKQKTPTKYNTKSGEPPKSYKLYDGENLYIEIFQNGSKIWRFRFKFPKENAISLGKYPKVSLAKAREERDKCLDLLKRGIDPSLHRRLAKDAKSGQAEDAFEVIAKEWLAKFIDTKSASHSKRVHARFDNDVFPWVGKRRIGEIEPQEMLAVISRIEGRGAVDTARRTLGSCSDVFRYAISTGRCKSDPCRDLRGSLKTPKQGHFAAVTKPAALVGILLAIDSYKGTLPVQCALKLAPLLFVRPYELRTARWTDIDLNNAEWCMELAKQDEGREGRPDVDDHLIVPLATQAIEILGTLRRFTGNGTYVFPCLRTKERPMSENAVLAALRRLGIPKEEMCGHGFRATARTILREQLKIEPEYIELELGHQVIDPNGRAYNRAGLLAERRLLMQEWANYLYKLKSGQEVPSLKPIPLTDIRMIQVAGFRN